MTIGLTWRRTARRIKRLKEGVLTISPDYSDRPTPDFLALSPIWGSDSRWTKNNVSGTKRKIVARFSNPGAWRWSLGVEVVGIKWTSEPLEKLLMFWVFGSANSLQEIIVARFWCKLEKLALWR